jgi:Cu/Ag efflux protein CusF
VKNILVAFVALLTLVAFGSVVMAQAPAKPAAPPAIDKPAAPATEKPKAEKKEAPKAMTASGTLASYEAGKTIKVKGKDKEMVFDVTGETNVKGEVKEGAKVTVMYKKDGDKMIATAITVAAEKKAEEKKPAPVSAEKKS